jgi:hypothetical protein
MAQNIIDVNTFYSLCFQGERRWYQIEVGRRMEKHPRPVLPRAVSTVATNRAHVAHVAPGWTGWTCGATAAGTRPRARPGAFTSAPVCPDCPDKPRPYACEGMLSVGQTTWPGTTGTSGTSGHVAEATWFKLSRLHNPLGQQGQWLCWYSTCFLRTRARSHGILEFR